MPAELICWEKVRLAVYQIDYLDTIMPPCHADDIGKSEQVIHLGYLAPGQVISSGWLIAYEMP